MTMNWSQEKCDCSSWLEWQGERQLHAQSETLVTMPTHLVDHILTDGVERESRTAAGHTRRKMWFVGWDVMLAALAGAMIFFFLDVASIGVFSSALIVTGIVAAVGLGHYLLWGRVFARGLERERQRFQDQARRSEPSETEPPDEFSMGINNRERRELLQLLEHSLATATGESEGSEEGAATRRELRDKIRMFGA